MSAQFFIHKTQSVELQVPGVAVTGNSQTNFQFTPQTFLQDKPTLSIETFCADDVTTSPLGNAIITIAQLKTAYINFYFQDPKKPGRAGEYIKQRPLITFHRVHAGNTNAFVWEIPKMVGQIIVWEKSSIIIPTAFANTTNLSFLFDVSYEFPDNVDLP